MPSNSSRSPSPREERSKGSDRGLTLPKPSKSKTPPKERGAHGNQSDASASRFFGVPAAAGTVTAKQATAASAAAGTTPPSPRSDKQAFLDVSEPRAETPRSEPEQRGPSEGGGLKLPKPSKSKTPPKERGAHGKQSDPSASRFFGEVPAAAGTLPEKQATAASAAAGSTLPSPRSDKQAFLDVLEPRAETPRSEPEQRGPSEGGGLKLPKPSKSQTPPKERGAHGKQSDASANRFFGEVPAATGTLPEKQATAASVAAVSTPPSPGSDKQAFLDASEPRAETPRSEPEQRGPSEGGGLKLPKPSKSKTPPKERGAHGKQSDPSASRFFGVPAAAGTLPEKQATAASAAAGTTPPSPRSDKQAFLDVSEPRAETPRSEPEQRGPSEGGGLKLPKPSKSKTPPKERGAHGKQSDPSASRFFGEVPAAAGTLPEKQATAASAAAGSTPPSPRSDKQAFLDVLEPRAETPRSEPEQRGPSEGGGLKLPKPSKSQTPPKERGAHGKQSDASANRFFGEVPAAAGTLPEKQATAASAAAGSIPPSPRSDKQAFLDASEPRAETPRSEPEQRGPSEGGGLKLPKPSKSQTPPKERGAHGKQSDASANRFFGEVPAAAGTLPEKQATAASAAAGSTPPSPRSDKQAFLDASEPRAETPRSEPEQRGPSEGGGLKLPKPSKSKTPPKERAHGHGKQGDASASRFFGQVSPPEGTEKQAAPVLAEDGTTPQSFAEEQQPVERGGFTGGSIVVGKVPSNAEKEADLQAALSTPSPSKLAFQALSHSATEGGASDTQPSQSAGSPEEQPPVHGDKVDLMASTLVGEVPNSNGNEVEQPAASSSPSKLAFQALLHPGTEGGASSSLPSQSAGSPEEQPPVHDEKADLTASTLVEEQPAASSTPSPSKLAGGATVRQPSQSAGSPEEQAPVQGEKFDLMASTLVGEVPSNEERQAEQPAASSTPSKLALQELPHLGTESLPVPLQDQAVGTAVHLARSDAHVATHASKARAAQVIQAMYRGWQVRRQMSQRKPRANLERRARGERATPALTLDSISVARLHANRLHQKASPTKRVRERDFARAAQGAPSPTVGSDASAPAQSGTATAAFADPFARDADPSHQNEPDISGMVRAVARLQAAYRAYRARKERRAKNARAERAEPRAGHAMDVGIAEAARLRVKAQKLHSQATSLRSEQVQLFLASTPAGEERSEERSEAVTSAAHQIRGSCRGWLARHELLALRHRVAVAKLQGLVGMRAQNAWEILKQQRQQPQQGEHEKAEKAEKPELQIAAVASLRVRAVRIHKLHEDSPSSPSHSPRSPRSPSPVAFFSEDPDSGPATEMTGKSARDFSEEDRYRAACRIQARQRGRVARREVAEKQKTMKALANRKMDIGAIGMLRVKVHNLHNRLPATSGKAVNDGTFFGMFADAAPPSAAVEEKAAIRIQACYRGQQGRRLAAERATSAMGVVGTQAPDALENVRRSLVAAGFAVVGEANAEIGRLLHRASLGLEEAAAMGDRVAQRASIALGETLLHMVVDTSSPPATPIDGESPSAHEAVEVEASPKKEILEVGRSMDKACKRVEAWLQKRRRQERPTRAPALSIGVSPLVQRRRELKSDLSRDDRDSRLGGSDAPAHDADPSNLLATLAAVSIRKVVEETDKKLEAVQLTSVFAPGSQCSTCGRSDFQGFPSVSSEIEFSIWAICPLCQQQLGMERGPLAEPRDYVLVEAGQHFEALSPFHAVPVAYPEGEDRLVWASPYHLFMAQHFLDPRCRKAVHCLKPSPAILRSSLSEDPLRTAVREDW